jgi:hypothetical protein
MLETAYFIKHGVNSPAAVPMGVILGHPGRIGVWSDMALEYFLVPVCGHAVNVFYVKA